MTTYSRRRTLLTRRQSQSISSVLLHCPIPTFLNVQYQPVSSGFAICHSKGGRVTLVDLQVRLG